MMRVRLPQSLTRTWDTADSSQRAAWVAIAMATVIVAAVVLVAAPLREAIARTRADVAHTRLVLDIARARIAEDATLVRASAPIRAHDPRAAIDRVLAQEGLKYTRVDAQNADGRIRIVIEDAHFDTLVRALDTLAREDGVRVADATFTARVDPGSVRAELALTR